MERPHLSCSHASLSLSLSRSQIAADEADWLDVVALNAADGATWALEVLRYGVDVAPAFVLLDGAGRAVARTGPVGGRGGGGGGGGGGDDEGDDLLASEREALLTGLDAIVDAGRPRGKGWRRG